jgi:uncharacterized membrane protein (DUF485 family)
VLYKAVFGLLSRMRRLLRVAPSFLGYGALGAQSDGGGGSENSGTSVPSEIKFLCLQVRWWGLTFALMQLVMGVVATVMYFLTANGVLSFDRMQAPVSQMVNVRRAVGSVRYSWQGIDLGEGAIVKDSCSFMETRNVSGAAHFLKPAVFSYGVVDMQLMLAIVYVVAAAFLAFNCLEGNSYNDALDKGDSHFYHFVEGSFTAPIVFVLLNARAGVSDLMILLGSACGVWCSMLFGQLASCLFDDTVSGGLKYGKTGTFEYYAVAHFAYWVSFVCSVATFASNNTVYSSCVSKLPNDVYAIVGVTLMYLMVFLYALFGTIQTFVLFYKPRKHEVDESDEQSIRTHRATIATYAEMAYIFIGFFTKTFLGMLLYIGSSV